MSEDQDEKVTPKMGSVIDFRQLVQAARSRAQAEIAKKRQQVYETFITEEVKSGRRVPMPKEFWQAVEGEIELTPPSVTEENAAEANALEIETSSIYEEEEVFSSPTEIEPPSTSKPAELSFKDAALIILKREGRAMTAREIVTIALNEGLVSSGGKTPDASLAGQIYTEIRRNRRVSPFIIVGPRTYALKHAPPPPTTHSQVKQSGTVVTGNFPWQGDPLPTSSPLPTTDATITTLSPTTTATKKRATKKRTKPTANKESLFDGTMKMSFKQVTIYLLEREKRAMTAREIITIALQEGLIASSGKTPDASLAGQLYTEMKHSNNANKKFPIKMVGPRTYALTDWEEGENR